MVLSKDSGEMERPDTIDVTALGNDDLMQKKACLSGVVACN
jgi:hypothetical protein